jgi:hypothetical protein
MRTLAVWAIACSAASEAIALSLAYPMLVENRRAREITLEHSSYASEADARSLLWRQQKRERDQIRQLKIPSGQSKPLIGGLEPWMVWCQIDPPSSLPCEVVDVRKAVGTRIVFE